MAEKKKVIKLTENRSQATTQPSASGDAPTGKKKREDHQEPEEVPKSISEVLREEAEYRALARKNRFKRRWPHVNQPPIKTRPWRPPNRPKKLPRIFINLPELKTRKWVPPQQRRRRARPRLQRIPPEQLTQPLPDCARLTRGWHNFRAVEPNKMVLQGTTACNARKYGPSTRGAQTGCIAAIMSAVLDEKTAAQLTRRDVDEVIDAGDKYYRQCLLCMKCYKGKPQLQLNQLSPVFFYGDTKYTFKISEAERGVLAKSPDAVSAEPDLQQLMDKRAGTAFAHILTLGRRHFFVWGHPPPADSGSSAKTIVYMLDPHQLNEMGQPDHPGGFGAFLRYAGVFSFVTDFLANYADVEDAARGKPPPPVVLSNIEILQKEPIVRDPTYQLDLKILKPHCRSEWDSMNMNALIERKVKHGEYPRESLSAVSLATSRNERRRKIKDFYQRSLTPGKEAPIVPPVAPEKGPVGLTMEQMLNMRGEDFFLYCPKFDSHTFGRDDMIPRPQSETVLHSPVEVADRDFASQFKQIDADKWILRGTRHMASYRYQTFKVFTAVPCVVAAIASLRRHRARAWNEDTVDETLDAGYNIYRESLMVRGGPIRRLVLGELKESFKLRDKEYTHKEKGIAVWGKLVSNDPKVFDLCRGIEHFYKESDSGLLQIPGELEMGIWSEAGKYYLYHPWPADAYGNRVGLQGGGKACVLRFNTIAALCDHVHANTADIRRKPFCISNVGVAERPEMPEPVNKMTPVAPDRWVVRGRFHEGDARFPSPHRARQATPASIVAVAQSHLRPPQDWGPDDVDETVVKGDVLYGSTIHHLEKLGMAVSSSADEEKEGESSPEEEKRSVVGGNLAAADVLNRFTLNTYDCIETDVNDSAYSGTLTGDPAAGLLSLKQSLKQLFRGQTHAVLTARGASLAVWKHEGSYYMFDPHGCDENGYPSDEPRAAAALVRIKGSSSRLADAVMGNLPPGADDSFNLSPVAVIATKLNPEIGAPETKLESKAFQWINKGTAAIMLGPRGENSAIGKAAQKAAIGNDDMAGRALALPAAAAFCAATPSAPPPHMHHEHMFNLLDAGAEYLNNFYKKTGRKEITPEDLNDKFELGVNTFSIELGEPLKLPLRLPDKIAEGGDEEEEEEGGGKGEQAEEEEPKLQPLRQIKEALFAQWCDLTKPRTTHLLVGDYHTLGVWMEAGGKVVAFDPAPTLNKGLLTPQRVRKGDELRTTRMKEEMTGEEAGDEEDDEEVGGEGEERPEPEPEYVPPESCPALMVFASPGEFIDKLTAQGRLDKKQCLAPYKLYPVTVTNELTANLKDKKSDKPKAEGEEGAEEDVQSSDTMVPELGAAAVGRHFTRLGRSKASVRGRVAQGENYFSEESNRDLQDAANSVMGIVVDAIEPHIHWKPQVVDAILKYGDRLHTISLPSAANPPRLSPSELKRQFKASSFQIKLDIDPEVVSGDIKAGDTGPVLSLKKAITQFLDQYKRGVLCAKDYCVGIWRAADDKGVCYWDPHYVGPAGGASPAGAATLVAFSTVEELADTFKSNVEALGRPGSNRFTLSNVKVDWELAKPGLFDSKPAAVPDEAYELKVLTGYVEIGKGKTILRGPRPANAMKFSRSAVQECAATAIVAACMSCIRTAALWSKRTVRDISRAGAVLSERSMTALGYELRLPSENLMPLQILKRFVLGVNYVCYDLAEAFSGKTEQSQGNDMSVKSALERFFTEHTHGILWSAPYAAAVWMQPGVPPYFMFDPAPCGPTGLHADTLDDATTCVMTFTSPKMMAYAFLQNIPSTERQKRHFNLYAMAVKVTPLQRADDGREPALLRHPGGAVPATSKVGIDGLKRHAREEDRRHPPGDPTCHDAQRVAEAVDREEGLKGHRNPNGWLVLLDKSQYLSAQHSMHCKKFSQASRGNQALACAVMAVAMSAVEDVCRWCSRTLDQLLESGDQLYQDSYLHYRPRAPVLTIQQILRKFYTPGNCVCRVVVYQSRHSGKVDQDLLHQLSEFFREEKRGVFVAGKGDFAVALFKTARGYYMFDSDDRDRVGRAVPPPCRGRARAVLAHFPTVQALAERLSANVPPVVREEPAKKPEKEPTKDDGESTPKPDKEGRKLSVKLEEKSVRIEEPASFEIYGMSVSSLRRLNQHEQ